MRLCPSLSYEHQCGFLLPDVLRQLLVVVVVVFIKEEIFPYEAAESGYPWGEVNLGSSNLAILNQFPSTFEKFFDLHEVFSFCHYSDL